MVFTIDHNKLQRAIKSHSEGKWEFAEKEYMEIIDENPIYYEAIRHLGILYFDKKNYESASKYFEKAIEVNKNGFEAITNLGRVKMLQEKYPEAENLFRQAFEINSKYLPTLINYSEYYLNIDESELCLKFATKAKNQYPNDPAAKSIYAKSLINTDQENQAIVILETLVKEYPIKDYYRHLCIAYLRIGETSKAKEILKHIFKNQKYDPDFFIMYVNQIGDDINQDTIDYFENFTDDNSNDTRDRVTVSEALYNYFKNRNNYDLSAEYLIKMNELQYSEKEFELDEVRDFYSFLKTIQIKNFDLPNLKKNSLVPIFICGMPRSGTTLCEQILSSHSNVHGAGERMFLSRALGIHNPLNVDIGSLDNFKTNLEKVEFPLSVRKNYFREIAKLRRQNEQFVCDKLPHNFLFINIIQKIFPEAKIIYCEREAMENCFSLYATRFHGLKHQYSYDQEILGEYFLMHKDLIDHYMKRNFENIFILKNRDLIDNQEQVTRELLEFCKLNWEPSCLKFYENKRVVTTASRDRVREPLNKKSFKLWENYKASLTDLEKTLNQ